MSLSFTRVKLPAIPKVSTKLSTFSAPKISGVSIKQPKLPSVKSFATPNIAKYSKLTSIPKPPKVTILKNAIKKVTNKGY